MTPYREVREVLMEELRNECPFAAVVRARNRLARESLPPTPEEVKSEADYYRLRVEFDRNRPDDLDFDNLLRRPEKAVKPTTAVEAWMSARKDDVISGQPCGGPARPAKKEDLANSLP